MNFATSNKGRFCSMIAYYKAFKAKISKHFTDSFDSHFNSKLLTNADERNSLKQ